MMATEAANLPDVVQGSP